MKVLLFVCLVAVTLKMTLAKTLADTCRPGDNCREPNCRCWNDPSIPGGYAPSDVPQIVLISFEYAVNTGNIDLYKSIFDGIKNPNNCDPKGTFFVQKDNTDFGTVRELYENKFEIGLTTPDGTIPQTADQWLSAYQEMRAEILQAGVPDDKIRGSRGPELYVGGNDMFDALKNVGLEYDSTCSTVEYTTQQNLLWPYTYDFVEDTPQCTIGRTPDKSYPGKWQFIVADLEFNGEKCASPSSCSPQIKTSQDAFDLLYESFNKHYNGARSPFHLFLDAAWLTRDIQAQGTIQFLQFIRTALNDTWILTTEQALEWMKDPVPNTNTTIFRPWSC